MISLDGVIQGPGGPKEDVSNGFKYGGWVAPYSDEVYDNVVKKELTPADYLLGRKTFQIWADYWPQHGDFWPGINAGMKYVLSKKLKKTDKLITGWENSTVIRTVADIKKIKQSKGADLHVWGSSELIHLLLKNDLVDELHLKISHHLPQYMRPKKIIQLNALPKTLNGKIDTKFLYYFAK